MTRNVRNERKTHHQGTHPAVAAFLSPDVEGFSGVTYQSTADIVSDARTIIESANDDARTWYAREASEQGWSVRTLARNIGTKYYERLLLSDNKKPVEQEMRAKTADYQTREYQVTEFIKDPYIAEFLGFSPDAEVRETDLESAILANLQKFLLEMGKGYAFMGRQYHLRGISGDYYIDLVFYNVILKCYVLVDLKCDPVTHQDIGQMDMYVRMFDDKVRRADDNPTIGIVLTSETSEDIARYSVLHGNDQLYTSSYLLYLPNEEELRRTIETEKQRFVLAAGQTDENGDDC